MKTIISWLSFLLIIFVGGIMISCEHINDKMLMDKHFKGKHELRRFNIYNETTKQSTGTYFIILGSYSSIETTQTKIRFCWKHPDGTFVFSEVSFDKIKVRIVNTDKPFIEFRIDKFERDCNSDVYLNKVEEAFYWVDYVIINCKEEDFPVDVNLKDLK